MQGFLRYDFGFWSTFLSPVLTLHHQTDMFNSEKLSIRSTLPPIWLLLARTVTFLSSLGNAKPKRAGSLNPNKHSRLSAYTHCRLFVSTCVRPTIIPVIFYTASSHDINFLLSSKQPVNNADFIIPVEIDGTVHQVTALTS